MALILIMGIRSHPEMQVTFSESLLVSKSGMLHDISAYIVPLKSLYNGHCVSACSSDSISVSQ